MKWYQAGHGLNERCDPRPKSLVEGKVGFEVINGNVNSTMQHLEGLGRLQIGSLT